MVMTHVKKVPSDPDLTQHLWVQDGVYILTSWSGRPGYSEILAFVADAEGNIPEFNEVEGSRYVEDFILNHEAIATLAFARLNGGGV